MKHFLCALLLAAFMCSVMSCGGTGDSEVTTPESVSDVTTDAPKPSYDFGGREYRILCRTDKSYEFDIAEETGDLVNDAIYKRNLQVESDYGVRIKPIAADGTWDERQIFIDLIGSSVLANDDSYDLVAGYRGYIVSLITQGYLTELSGTDVDFSKPWWYSGFNDNVSIGGKMYFCLGDASLTMWESLEVVFFNRGLLADNKLDSPYELVNSDAWYFDTMREYCAKVSSDLDGNDTMDENDRWGMIFYNIRDLATYFGNSYCTKDKDGMPVLSLYTERMVDSYAKLFDFLNPSNEARQFVPDTDQKIFSEGRALFFQAPLRYAALLRDSATDFGIVPFPKYDKSQTQYYTTVVDDHSVFCVPISSGDPEFSMLILDALCEKSSELVVPEYYEKALKVKYSRDTESVEMLDLARECVWFDFGFTYSQAIGNIGSFLDILKSNNSDIASAWASKAPAYESALEELIAYFKEN